MAILKRAEVPIFVDRSELVSGGGAEPGARPELPSSGGLSPEPEIPLAAKLPIIKLYHVSSPQGSRPLSGRRRWRNYRASGSGGDSQGVSDWPLSAVQLSHLFIQVCEEDGAIVVRAKNCTRLISVDGQRWCSTCSCLLYTSPSPRDLSTSRMPSSA